MATTVEGVPTVGDELFTIREFTVWARLKTTHMAYVEIRRGKLRAVRLGEKGSLRIRKADAIAWLKPVEPKRAES